MAKGLQEILSSKKAIRNKRDSVEDTIFANQCLRDFVGASSKDVEGILRNAEGETTEGITDEEFEDMINRYIENQEDIYLKLKVEAILKKLSKVNRNRIISEVLEEIL